MQLNSVYSFRFSNKMANFTTGSESSSLLVSLGWSSWRQITQSLLYQIGRESQLQESDTNKCVPSCLSQRDITWSLVINSDQTCEKKTWPFSTRTEFGPNRIHRGINVFQMLFLHMVVPLGCCWASNSLSSDHKLNTLLQARL